MVYLNWVFLKIGSSSNLDVTPSGKRSVGRITLVLAAGLSLLSASELKGCEEDVTIFDGVGVKSTSSSSNSANGSDSPLSSVLSVSSVGASSLASSSVAVSSLASSFGTASSSAPSSLAASPGASSAAALFGFKSALNTSSAGRAPSEDDLDNDGLTNSEERDAKTDTLNPDSDYDGYLDSFEVKNGTNPLDSAFHPSNPPAVQNLLATESFRFSRKDRDGDGIPDSVELEIGSNPDLPDTDGDKQNDGAEVVNEKDPLVKNDAPVDSDGDGLSEEKEKSFGTNPGVSDTDKDGLPDLFEILFNSDPRNPDTDGDGVIDGWDPTSGTYKYRSSRIVFPGWK